MPIYEYRCKSCEKVFEVIQQSAERQLRTCRDCSGRLEKLISRTAFHLKGGGWYTEGYSKDGSKNGDSKKDDASKKDDLPKKTEASKKADGPKKAAGKSGSSSGDAKSSSGSKD